MVIFSEIHLSAYSGTIDINVICQFCNKPHILPGFTLIPHKSNASYTALRTWSRKHKREISLDYITDEKHYPLGTTDEYFKAPEPDEEYIVHLCGDTVILSNGLLVQALSRLPAQKQEMLYLSFFKRMPQHEIGRRYGRSRSAAGYHIRKAIQQLYEEMEGLAHEE